MCIVNIPTAVLQLSFVAQAHAYQQAANDTSVAQSFVNKVFDTFFERALTASEIQQEHLDETTLRKPGNPGILGGSLVHPCPLYLRAAPHRRQDLVHRSHCRGGTKAGATANSDVMDETELYEALGFSSRDEGLAATPDELKTAYRSLAKVSHPDLGGSESQMRQLIQAYTVLSNPELRAAYDSRSISTTVKRKTRKYCNPFTTPTEVAEHVFVHEWRATMRDVEDALSQAPDYFTKSETGSVRYSKAGKVQQEDINRVHVLVSQSFSGCFHWVTGEQEAALTELQQQATDGFARAQDVAYELDILLAEADFENNRYDAPSGAGTYAWR